MQVGGNVFANSSVGTPARLNGSDPLGGQSLVAGEELCVLTDRRVDR